jgi:hypothetical protein
LERLVESLIDGIVFGGVGPVEIPLQIEFEAASFEVLFKFRAIVSLDVFNVSIKEVKESVQKISGVQGIGIFVHSGKGHFGEVVYSRENVPLEIVPAKFNGVQAKQKAILWFFLEFGNPFLFPGF